LVAKYNEHDWMIVGPGFANYPTIDENAEESRKYLRARVDQLERFKKDQR